MLLRSVPTHSTHTPHESSRFPSQACAPFGNLRSICWNEMETSHLKLETTIIGILIATQLEMDLCYEVGNKEKCGIQFLI